LLIAEDTTEYIEYAAHGCISFVLGEWNTPFARVDFERVWQYFGSNEFCMRPAMPILRTSSLVLLTLFVTFPMRLANADDRVPAVAGQFYPASATELRETLKQLFTQARKPSGTDDIRALIVPHAGYVFSGLVAASGFLQIDPGRDVANVFLIGVSHTAAYAGAAVYIAGDFLTPLGRVPVNKDIGRHLLAQRGLFLEHNRAHEAEHSLEVQLPFLQYP